MKKILSFIFMLLVMLGLTSLTACDKKDDEQTPPTTQPSGDQTIVDEVAKTFTFTKPEVSNDFTLSTSAAGGVLISWTSNNAAIAINGQNAKVTRPAFADGDATVTLTATFKKGDATATKTYTVTVKAQEDAATIQTSTVAQALVAEVGTTVTVRGIVAAFHVGSKDYPTSKQGLYLIDTTGVIYVYGYQLAGEVEKGDEIIITATKAEYNNAKQLSKPNLDSTVSKGNDIPRDTVSTAQTISSLASNLTDTSFYGLYLKFENVTIKKITGTDSETGEPYSSYSLMDGNGNEVNLYSGGNSSEFAEYDKYVGKTLTVTYVVNGQNKKGTKWRGHIVEVLEVGDTFTPGQGGTTDPNPGETPSDVKTVAEAIALATGQSITIKGIVSGFHWGKLNEAPSIQGCYVADTTGVIYVYGFALAQSVTLGDEIVVTGTKDEYYSSKQLKNPTLNSTVSTGNAIPKDYAITDVTLADVADNLTADHYSKPYIFDNVSIKKIDGGSYYNYQLIDANGKFINLYSSNDGSEFEPLDQYIGKSIKVLFVVSGQPQAKDKWRGHVLEVLTVNGDFNGGTTDPNPGETPEQPGEGGTTEPEQPTEPSGMTIADAIAAYQADANTQVVITGIIYKITGAYFSGGNYISVDIVDSTGIINCYQMTGGSNLKVGDLITVTGKLTTYNSKMQVNKGSTYATASDDKTPYIAAALKQAASSLGMNLQGNHTLPTTLSFAGTSVDLAWADANGAVTEILYTKPASDTAVTLTVTYAYNGETVNIENTFTLKAFSATSELSFASTSSRTEFSTSKQVWTNGRVTLTNDKASSSNAVADYANPARFYGGSKITIDATNITKIVFTVSESKYATPAVNSAKTISGATVTQSGNVITIVLKTPVDKVSFSLTAQVRISKMVVSCD